MLSSRSWKVHGGRVAEYSSWCGPAIPGQGNFKTPTLREIGRTAPYMHDGSIATLEDVIEYYDRGGNRNSSLDPEVQPLRLSPVEKQELAAFLRGLSGTINSVTK